MRVPRVQFAMRHLMIGVVVVACAVWVEKTRRRWLIYRERATECADSEQHWRARAETDNDPAILVNIDYFARMRPKYAHLVSHPWEADPDDGPAVLPIPRRDVPPEYALGGSSIGADGCKDPEIASLPTLFIPPTQRRRETR